MIKELAAGNTIPTFALAIIVLAGSGILLMYVQRQAKKSKDYAE
jgi:lysozyme family protein